MHIGSCRTARSGVAALALAAAGAGASVLALDSPPDWMDEPPVLSRWLEDGYAAEIRRQPRQAAQRYCAAARYGSVEAQYRLGRLLLLGRDVVPDLATAVTVLAMAAQRGHEKARQLTEGRAPAGNDSLPDCLVTG